MQRAAKVEEDHVDSTKSSSMTDVREDLLRAGPSHILAVGALLHFVGSDPEPKLGGETRKASASSREFSSRATSSTARLKPGNEQPLRSLTAE